VNTVKAIDIRCNSSSALVGTLLPADYTVDLSGLNLVLPGDILVSLELLRSYSTPCNPWYGILFSCSLHSGTWRRQTSQGQWKKAHGIGVGFNMEVRLTRGDFLETWEIESLEIPYR
jgi:hypothetical protein